MGASQDRVRPGPGRGGQGAAEQGWRNREDRARTRRSSKEEGPAGPLHGAQAEHSRGFSASGALRCGRVDWRRGGERTGGHADGSGRCAGPARRRSAQGGWQARGGGGGKLLPSGCDAARGRCGSEDGQDLRTCAGSAPSGSDNWRSRQGFDAPDEHSPRRSTMVDSTWSGGDAIADRRSTRSESEHSPTGPVGGRSEMRGWTFHCARVIKHLLGSSAAGVGRSSGQGELDGPMLGRAGCGGTSRESIRSTTPADTAGVSCGHDG